MFVYISSKESNNYMNKQRIVGTNRQDHALIVDLSYELNVV